MGAVAGPLATGSLANSRGFHAGFTLAAGLMLVALMIYLFGQRLLPEPPLRRADRPIEAPLSPAERSRSRAIAAVIALNIPTVISFQMIGGIGIIWIDDRVKLATALGSVPPSWFNSLESFASIVAMGWVGRFYDQMSHASFWALDAAISLAGALLTVILLRPIGRALDSADPPLEVAGESDLASSAAA
ncbi:MAG: hypothetical protein ABIR77_08485 [Sphingomicrobium sp.]